VILRNFAAQHSYLTFDYNTELEDFFFKLSTIGENDGDQHDAKWCS